MKKPILALAAMMITAATSGQGTVQFNNRLLAYGIDARIFLASAPISDPSFKAQIYAGPEGAAVSSLKAVPVTTTFRTGNSAGYLNPIPLLIPGIAPGAKATLVVRVYNGLTFESSTISGTSNPITIALGAAGTPPGPSAELIGLESFTITPEPSTSAPPKFNPVARQGSNLTLSWSGTGTLQQADAANGPWTNAASQSNPQTVPLAGGAKFYRLRQ